MADNNSTFFGNVFDDPEDDPLLENENASSDASAESPEQYGTPSWVDDDAASRENEETDRTQKTIVLDQRSGKRKGIDELNQSIEEGWELVRLALYQSDDQAGAGAAPVNRRFVAELSQEGPASLFDFGAGT